MCIYKCFENESNKFDVKYTVNSDWNTGYSSTITIVNNSNKVLEDWVLEFDFDREKETIWATQEEIAQIFGVNRPAVVKHLRNIFKDGELVYEETPTFEKGKLSSVCKYQNNGVAEKTAGAKYECEVKPGVKYNFYVLSKESDGTTNLIMDRNICEDGTLATKDTVDTEASPTTEARLTFNYSWIIKSNYVEPTFDTSYEYR